MPAGASGQARSRAVQFCRISSFTWVRTRTRVSGQAAMASRMKPAMTTLLPVPVGITTKGLPALAPK